jgi:acetolactate synthase-1/2/3 large subunit
VEKAKKSQIEKYQAGPKKGPASKVQAGQKVSGARALMESIKLHGGEVVFGLPGGVMLPAYDVLYDDGGISHILVGHEQGGCHMADGFARATGKVGVCFATSGPGATNLVTGLCTAHMDSVPVVAVTGQVRTTVLGKDAFQEADITGITMPVTKHNYLVSDPASIPRIIAEAFYIARFDDRVTGKVDAWAPGAKIIHIDIDPAEIGKIYIPDVALNGDCRQVLQALLPLIAERGPTEWNEQIERWKQEFPLWYPKGEDRVYPQAVCEELWNVTKGEAIVTTGVGQHQMWAAQFYRCKHPRTFITSGGLGTMGFGLPAAIGCAVGVPDRPVWCVDGDGSFIMTSEELMPAVQHRIPVKVAIINNFCLGMVRQWQSLFWDERLSAIDLSYQPDFVKLAEAYGAVGIRVTRPEEIRPAIEKASEINDRPVVVDFHVVRDENVLPMIPAGQTIEQMMVEKPR